MTMDEKDRQEAIRIRDYVNGKTTPVLRGKDSNIKTGQDKLNYYFNSAIYGTVWVRICQGTKKVANQYCPSVKNKKFIKGEEPIEKCTVHKKPVQPTIHKLDPKKVYKADGKHKLVCPFLIPSFGINRLIKEEDAEWFADKFAQQGWGNFMRLFVAGNWEPYWQQENRIWFPYLKKSGKFNLEKYNPKHFDCLFRRADYLVERDIIPMFTLLDNCSLHHPRPGYWSTHWMNGDRNVNNTCNERYSQTHWYEENGLPPDSSPEKKVDGMLETGKYLMDLYGFILDKAKARYGKFFLIEIGNEIDARIIYHRRLKKFIDGKLGGNNYWRIFTSLCRDHFYKVSVHESCVPVVHGVQTIDDFKRRKQLVPTNSNYMVSCDGETPLTSKPTKEVVSHILNSDSMGYEGNVRPIFEWKDNKWVNVCGKEDWTLRSFRFGLCKAFGEAFSEYLGG